MVEPSDQAIEWHAFTDEEKTAAGRIARAAIDAAAGETPAVLALACCSLLEYGRALIGVNEAQADEFVRQIIARLRLPPEEAS
jgi:hypothetical protein